jgi:hypothetical protein
VRDTSQPQITARARSRKAQVGLFSHGFTEPADRGVPSSHRWSPHPGRRGRPLSSSLPLVGSGRTVVAEYGPLLDAGPAHSLRGVLPILDWGCGMYAAVDCLDPVAPVLLFEPNAGPDDWADAWFLDSPSLAQWLDRWLAGTGWWEEEDTVAEDAHDPVP